MMKTSTRIFSTILLLLAVACGGSVKPTQTPNDEVTAPLGVEDKAALEEDSLEEVGDEPAQESAEEAGESS